MEFIERVLSNPEGAYVVIFALSLIVYKLGFTQQKLPLLKELIVYAFLAVGVFPLTVLYMLGLPIVPALFIAFVIMGISRLRQWQTRREAKGGQ